MNAERLLALYDQVADAPNAVGQLRRFVLDLAVRGKLVRQNPADEPASELLKWIEAEKTRLMKTGEIKSRKLKFRPRQDPIVFVIPSGWILTDLRSVSLKITDGTHKTPTYVSRGVPFVSVKDFSAGRLDLSDTRSIPRSEHEALCKRCDPRRGDILLGRIGTLGKAVIVDTDVEFSLFVSVGLIRFNHAFINPVFFRMVLNSPFVEAEFDRIKIGGGTHTNKLNVGDLHTVAFLLPPLAEQHRIVDKVNELMALCDRLERTRVAREDTRDRLTKASFTCLNASDSDSVAFRFQSRFTVDAFPALTAHADQVENLRRTILDLAVRGKLVEQDPADEPASELLERVAEEKSQLRVRHDIEPLATDEIPFLLPEGWLWSRIGELCTKTGSGSTPRGGKNVYKPIGVPFLRSQNVYNDGLRLDDVARIDPDVHDRMARTTVQGRDLLLNITGGSMGRCCRVPDKFGNANVSQHVAIIRPAVSEMADFLHRLVLSPYFQGFIFDEQTGAGRGGLPKRKMDRIVVAVPPLVEQHRIVAKVNELMALCISLETSLHTASNARHCLLESLLREALEPPVDELEAVE